jgi:hypothetical protein
MKLNIRSFADTGDFEKERMSLKVLANTNIGAYAVLFEPSNIDGDPTSGRKTAYWFPDLDVEAGDMIILYTKDGERRTKELATGHTAHFFYWGLKNPIWNTRKGGCVLLSVDEWQWKQAQATE